jgi:transposase
VVNRTLLHEGDQVREFYSQLPQPVLVGIEAVGPMQWFLDLLQELEIECQVGDAAKARAAAPRKQKHDLRDAELILKLLVEKRFPAIWMPSKELLDLRALLLHRHQWVRLRTQIQNALQAIALANVRACGVTTDKRRSLSCPCRLTPRIDAARYRRNIARWNRKSRN